MDKGEKEPIWPNKKKRLATQLDLGTNNSSLVLDNIDSIQTSPRNSPLKASQIHMGSSAITSPKITRQKKIFATSSVVNFDEEVQLTNLKPKEARKIKPSKSVVE